jgi:acyl dehydratase
MMRMACDGFVLNSSSMGAPGVDEVKWLKPLRPGTNITLQTTVLETRASNSRPEMGFVKIRMEVLGDDREPVMTLTTSMIMGRRAPGVAAG